MKYLWKLNPAFSDYYFFPEAELPKLGFQSVYGVPDAEAERMEVEGFAGYSGPLSGGHRLWLDCDSDAAAKLAEQVAIEQGLAYEVWTTGNRGAHIGISRHIEDHAEVYRADKAWVAQHVPSADLKLYSPLHLFRRPGAVHTKTGKKKQLVKSVPGVTLLLAPPQEVKHHAPRQSTTNSSVFNDPLILALSVPHHDGTRHQAFLSLARRLAKTGVSREFIYEWLEQVNLLGDPWPEDKLSDIAEWACRSCRR